MKSLRKITQKWHFWNRCFCRKYLLLALLLCSLSCGSEEKGNAAPSEAPLKEEQNISGFENFEEEILVEYPAAGEKISSPLEIRGKARGSWFFEATAPVELVLENGEIIARSYITATGDWMTEDFVPFTAEVSFPLPKVSSGYLVMKNANPSGLPGHDRKIKIPVQFPD